MNEMVSIQTKVNEPMRSLVVDWIIEVNIIFFLNRFQLALN